MTAKGDLGDPLEYLRCCREPGSGGGLNAEELETARRLRPVRVPYPQMGPIRFRRSDAAREEPNSNGADDRCNPDAFERDAGHREED